MGQFRHYESSRLPDMSDNPGELKGSAQHWLEVYSQELATSPGHAERIMVKSILNLVTAFTA